MSYANTQRTWAKIVDRSYDTRKLRTTLAKRSFVHVLCVLAYDQKKKASKRSTRFRRRKKEKKKGSGRLL